MSNNFEIPYAAAREMVDRLGIRYDELPQRPFWAQVIGRTQEDFRVRVTAKIMAGSALAGRELTQPETDALALHYARLLRVQAFDTPIAAGAALIFYRYTYASYGFPMYTPKADKFNPNKFPGLPEGPFAQKAWHGLRLLAWYSGCKVVASTFCLSYAIATYSNHYASDPRLQSYRQSVTARQQQQIQQRAQQSGQQSPRGVPGRTSAPTSWASTEQTTQDAPSTWPGMSSPNSESSQASYDDEPYVFDDASPVAPAEQQRGPPQQSTQGGSAWDRIRGQARGGAAAHGQGSAGQATAWGQKRQDELTSRGAQQGTSYTFSSADEERAYAKEQAQKDFDEMLERERRGQSDTSNRRF